MKKRKENKQIVIYQAHSGAIEFRGDWEKETIWASLNQIAGLFDVQKAAVSKHLTNIFTSKELSKTATVSKMETVQIEGDRAIKRSIEMYNLDAIIAVGYRVNSKRATQFRIWATKTLKDHLLRGYTVNRKRIAQNYGAFMKAVADIQALLPERAAWDSRMVLELIKEFASTWVSIGAYDKETLKIVGATKKSVKLAGGELIVAIQELRTELAGRGESSSLFAEERRAGVIEGIVGNVMQSFGGRQLYRSVEEKAAHLLYFMVKNHPFVDGNKRCGAFAFIWFLRKSGVKSGRNISPASLTALTLLIAESDPKKKDQMVALVTQLIR